MIRTLAFFLLSTLALVAQESTPVHNAIVPDWETFNFGWGTTLHFNPWSTLKIDNGGFLQVGDMTYGGKPFEMGGDLGTWNMDHVGLGFVIDSSNYQDQEATDSLLGCAVHVIHAPTISAIGPENINDIATLEIYGPLEGENVTFPQTHSALRLMNGSFALANTSDSNARNYWLETIESDGSIRRIWSFGLFGGPDDTGSNTGSEFYLQCYDDTNNFLDNPLVISRSTRFVFLGPNAAGTFATQALEVGGNILADGQLMGSGAGITDQTIPSTAINGVKFGNAACTASINHLTVTGLGLGFTPSGCIATVLKDASGNDNVTVTIDKSTLSSDGFTAYFSEAIPNGNYVLSYILTAP